MLAPMCLFATLSLAAGAAEDNTERQDKGVAKCRAWPIREKDACLFCSFAPPPKKRRKYKQHDMNRINICPVKRNGCLRSSFITASKCQRTELSAAEVPWILGQWTDKINAGFKMFFLFHPKWISCYLWFPHSHERFVSFLLTNFSTLDSEHYTHP